MRPLVRRLPSASGPSALALALALSLGACSAASSPVPATTPAAPSPASSTESTAPPEESSDAPEPSQASGAPDSCALVTAEQVAAINGGGGEPTRDGGTSNGTFTIDACHYGSLTTGLVSVEVASPASGFNPVTSTLEAAAQPTSIPSLPGGTGYPVGIMLGGGGQGYTVTATSGDLVVAVSLLTGQPVTPVQIEALTAAAKSAVGRL